MIGFVEGVLISAGPEAVVAVGGVGLDVHLSALAADRLPPVGQTVRLWTHLAVREDGWSLYGFLQPQDRQMFRLLISVSGIGPKVAMGMLSRASAADIALYLRTGDEKSLCALPGIGKKSAARLVVELGQRVPQPEAGGAGAAAPETDAGGLAEALAVLAAMGLPPAAAVAALRAAQAADPALTGDLERWVRGALRRI